MGLGDIVDSFKELDWSVIQNMDIRDRRVQVALAAVGVTSVYALYRLTRKKYNLPPGPRPWPVIGNLLSLEDGEKRLFEIFMDFAAVHGDIFTIYLGSSPAVILNSPDAIREAFLDNGNDYMNRHSTFSTDIFKTADAVSIAFGDGTPVWKLQRKIAHAALRKFASGIQLERMLHSGTSDIIDLILKEDGQPFNPSKYMTLLIYNTIGSMVFGKTFELGDEWYEKMIADSYKVNEIFSIGFMADIFPILSYLPNSSAKFIRDGVKHFEKFLLQNVQEHRDSFNPDDISDFVYYLMEAESQAREDPSEDKDALRMLKQGHFLGILIDIFFAGTDSTRFTLQWVIAFTVLHPEVQAKLHKELDDVIGPNGVIKLTDKAKLPYTEAVLYETLRMRPLAPFAVPHATNCDTKLRNFTLPKGTQVWPNIWALHMNPTLWEDPQTFNPERWIGEEGKHRNHPYQFLPFSTGRRVCVGESFVKVELNLVIALLYQKLEFRAPAGQEDTFRVDMAPGSAQVMAKPFDVVASQR